jgi:putative ABC transport system permease protein
MIRHLLKGLLRDRHRSLFPVMIVAAGVSISILMYCFMDGMIDDMVRSSARLDTGHLKVVTRGYNDLISQLPNDLAIRDSNELLAGLRRDHPDMEWTGRIKFGGLLDFPDENGETRAQGPAIGFAADLVGEGSKEIERLNLETALVRGRLPASPGEILVSEEFAARLGVDAGETATLIGSTAYGSMAVHNFILVGTVRFGIAPLDRNTIIADLSDIQYALDMDGAISEILGFYPNMIFDAGNAGERAEAFNSSLAGREGDTVPLMLTLRDQNGLGIMLDLARMRSTIIIALFIVVMSIVLWNTGLMSGIRRYGEFGVRLAIGESKAHVYLTLIAEAVLVGLAGTAIGTVIGLSFSYFLQEVGWDITGMLQSSSVMMSNVMRARVSLTGGLIGLIPGLAATILGASFSGANIFRRQTSQLFKELEV